MERLLEVSGGDMRKAVTYLQSAHDLSGKRDVITFDMIVDVSGQVCTVCILVWEMMV